jgi:hypothetical protein
MDNMLLLAPSSDAWKQSLTNNNTMARTDSTSNYYARRMGRILLLHLRPPVRWSSNDGSVLLRGVHACPPLWAVTSWCWARSVVVTKALGITQERYGIVHHWKLLTHGSATGMQGHFVESWASLSTSRDERGVCRAGSITCWMEKPG